MNGEVILIVDDSPDITDSLSLVLEQEGRLIITCNDAESASVVIEHHELSFIVSDINFSGPFGYEGLNIVSLAKDRVPPIPIALISGAVTDQLRDEARRLGAVAILQKPFDYEELEELLRARAS